MKLLKIARIYILCSVFFMLMSCEKEVTVPNNPKIVVSVVDPLGNLEPDVEVILLQRLYEYNDEYSEVKRDYSNQSGLVSFEDLEIGKYKIMACEKISSNYVTVTTEENKEYHSKLIILK